MAIESERATHSRAGRIRSAWRWLGLPGVVLLAALLCDLLIVFATAFDDLGPKGRDLLLLPGFFAICGCALWARNRSVAATLSGAGVLVASTVLIKTTDTSAFSTLLNGISLSETVAGLELVVYCVSRARARKAITAVSLLVAATMFATFAREQTIHFGSRGIVTLAIGGVLLLAAVVIGLRSRDTSEPKKPTWLTRLLRDQWPLIGTLCLPLFLELYQFASSGIRELPELLTSVVAAACAVLSTRSPLRAGLALSIVIIGSGVTAWVAATGGSTMPLPFTEVLATLIVVIYLIRYAPIPRAWGMIGLLSLSVAITAVLTIFVADHWSLVLGDVASAAFVASLLLGIAVAIGFYWRARDSARARMIEAAVTEAQTSERMALARELHDVVAHHVTGIVVQAQAAKMMGAQNPALALEALGGIEQSGTEALAAMRRLVRSMRSHAEETQQATTDLAADLRRLAESGHHGVHTEVDLRLPLDVPQEVGRSALRLVQESLTNVGKHAADATCVWVLAEVTGRELHIKVRDNGRGEKPQPAGGSGGYGLVGMRERAELLRGRLVAGRDHGNWGWAVEAWLPLDPPDAE